jgi:hypothetical protein
MDLISSDWFRESRPSLVDGNALDGACCEYSSYCCVQSTTTRSAAMAVLAGGGVESVRLTSAPWSCELRRILISCFA